MTFSMNDASQFTRREALGLLGTAAGAGLCGIAVAGADVVTSAAGQVPVRAQRALKVDFDASALAATLSFF